MDIHQQPAGDSGKPPTFPTAQTTGSPVHADSIFRTAAGREVYLKVHRCLWSDNYPENSLAALEECLRAPVARAEIDINMLQDGDFLLAHDIRVIAGREHSNLFRDITRKDISNLRLMHHGKLSSHQPALFSEFVAVLVSIPAPTIIEVDMKDAEPLPWSRIEELVQMAQPVKQQLVFNCSDWNLRRLLTVDPHLQTGWGPDLYLDWVPEGREHWAESTLIRGAYGYLDRHPLATQRLTSVADYLSDRLSGILRLVPGARETHLRISAFEHMLEDGVTHAADLFHREGMLLDVWTLDAGTPRWQERMARVAAAGVDMITTNTPHELAEEGRKL